MISSVDELNKFLTERYKNKLSEKKRRIFISVYNKQRKKNLPYVHDIEHFSDLVQIPSPKIQYMILNKDKSYTTYYIKKKNGNMREINAPCKDLKFIQRWILDNILYKINPGDYAHGFIKNRSIATNAEKHVNQDIIFNIDLRACPRISHLRLPFKR